MTKDKYNQKFRRYLLRLTNGFDTLEVTEKNLMSLCCAEAVDAVANTEGKFYCATPDSISRGETIQAITKRLKG